MTAITALAIVITAVAIAQNQPVAAIIVHVIVRGAVATAIIAVHANATITKKETTPS